MSPILSFPTEVYSKCIFYDNATVLSCKVTVYWSGGNIRMFVGVSPDPFTAPAVYEEVLGLVSGVTKSYTLLNAGKALYWYIIKDDVVTIANQYDLAGNVIAPAIEISDIVTT